MPCFSVIEKFIDLLEKSTFYKVYIISKIHNTFVWLLETVCIKLPCKGNLIQLEIQTYYQLNYCLQLQPTL